MELIIVTGLSGAGKSCVMNTLEDAGSFCMDNLPAKLIPVFAKLLKEAGEHEKVAVVTDIRAGLTIGELKESLKLLSELEIPCKLLFLDCNEDELLARYKLTRRLHPLMNGEGDTLSSAISAEKNLLGSIKDIADYVIDTSHLTIAQSKARIFSTFCDSTENPMQIHFMSFGFKHGIPKDADYVFDVRFLPNPFYVSQLKELTGLDERVRNFVMENEASKEIEEHLIKLIDLTVPLCIKEGRGQMVIAFGCTGGHHRSVTFAERFSEYYKNKNCSVSVSHRDINK